MDQVYGETNENLEKLRLDLDLKLHKLFLIKNRTVPLRFATFHAKRR